MSDSYYNVKQPTAVKGSVSLMTDPLELTPVQEQFARYVGWPRCASCGFAMGSPIHKFCTVPKTVDNVNAYMAAVKYYKSLEQAVKPTMRAFLAARRCN